MKNHHLQKSVGGRQELAHDDLQELLALKILLVTCKLDLKLREKSSGFFLLEVHDGGENLVDGVQDELIEGSLDTVTTNLGPFLGLGVKVVVSLDFGQ